MKKPAFRSCGLGLAILALVLLVAPALAQVPQDMIYTGRLVDNLGAPLAGPVNLELRIFDAETAGTQLYAESHTGVPLDATGGFSVQLGLGTPLSGTFDAALFAEVSRYLEVVVGIEVLTPRQIFASVPWALVAQQANEIVPDPNAPRFEDCGNNTIADHKTGLLWEKKPGGVGFFENFCEAGGCSTILHNPNNVYRWSSTGTDPDGWAFTDFLARLNGDPTVVAAGRAEALGGGNETTCFAHHCDWHLPSIKELRSILIGPDAESGQPVTCSAVPCVDPGFLAVGGVVKFHPHWSMSTVVGGFIPAPPRTTAWVASFIDGTVFERVKTDEVHALAVRAGSCLSVTARTPNE